jgi:hypothetical protein
MTLGILLAAAAVALAIMWRDGHILWVDGHIAHHTRCCCYGPPPPPPTPEDCDGCSGTTPKRFRLVVAGLFDNPDGLPSGPYACPECDEMNGIFFCDAMECDTLDDDCGEAIRAQGYCQWRSYDGPHGPCYDESGNFGETDWYRYWTVRAVGGFSFSSLTVRPSRNRYFPGSFGNCNHETELYQKCHIISGTSDENQAASKLFLAGTFECFTAYDVPTTGNNHSPFGCNNSSATFEATALL